MKTKLLLLLLLTILLNSCSMMSFRNNKARGNAGIVRIPQYKTDSSGTFLWSHYDATKRGSVMFVKDGKIRVLAENSPDAAIQSITAITAKVKGLKGDIGEAEAAFNIQRTIAQLGKRTAAVNMLRDALYRLNEMYYATVDEKEYTRKLFLENKINKETYKIFADEDKASIKTLSEDKLVKLFQTIIDKVSEISIAESSSETKISEAESLANVEKSKAELKKYEALINIVQKTDGNLTKEKADEYLKELIKQ